LSAYSALCAGGSPEPSDLIITHIGRVWRPVLTGIAFYGQTGNLIMRVFPWLLRA
jgi:hypothetical protein